MAKLVGYQIHWLFGCCDWDSWVHHTAILEPYIKLEDLYRVHFTAGSPPLADPLT